MLTRSQTKQSSFEETQNWTVTTDIRVGNGGHHLDTINSSCMKEGTNRKVVATER